MWKMQTPEKLFYLKKNEHRQRNSIFIQFFLELERFENKKNKNEKPKHTHKHTTCNKNKFNDKNTKKKINE